MNTTQLLVYLGILVVASTGASSANPMHANSKKDLQLHLPNVARRALPDAASANSTITRVYGCQVFMRFCLVRIRFFLIIVLGDNDKVMFVDTASFDPDKEYCRDVAIRGLERGRNHVIRVEYYNDTGDRIGQEDKPITTTDAWCPFGCVFGKPHFRTYDLFSYSYQGTDGCNVTLTKACVAADPTFKIDVLLEASPLIIPGKLLTRVLTVFIEAYGTQIMLYRGWIIYVNGTYIDHLDLPYQAHPNITILDTILISDEVCDGYDWTIHVLIDGIGVVEFNSKFSVCVWLTDDKWINDNKVCGMFGTPDNPHNAGNEFLLSDLITSIPTTHANADQFGDSWESCP